MYRNLEKYIGEYERLLNKGSGNEAAFYAYDLYQIADMSGNNKWDLISNALCAGFMTGYKYTQRKSRKKKKEAAKREGNRNQK